MPEPAGGGVVVPIVRAGAFDTGADEAGAGADAAGAELLLAAVPPFPFRACHQLRLAGLATFAAVVAPFTTTRSSTISMVRAGTPARARSLTDAYGRPAMIFFAVAAPMPGSPSRSAWLAVLRSTGPVVAAPFAP